MLTKIHTLLGKHICIYYRYVEEIKLENENSAEYIFAYYLSLLCEPRILVQAISQALGVDEALDLEVDNFQFETFVHSIHSFCTGKFIKHFFSSSVYRRDILSENSRHSFSRSPLFSLFLRSLQYSIAKDVVPNQSALGPV